MTKSKAGSQLIAAFIALAAAFAGFNLLRSVQPSPNTVDSAPIIGEIQALKGDVEHRLPRSNQLVSLKSAGSLRSQELILTHPASEAVLSFKGGAVIRVLENSRFIAEVDASKTDALLGTLLEGRVEILQAGNTSSFRLFHQGREIDLKAPPPSSAPTLPKFVEAETAPLLSATVSDESQGKTPRVAPQSNQPSPTRAQEDTLTDDEIARQIRSQTGFFQRCYLSFVNRLRTQDSDPQAQAAGPTGTVVVGFTIQANGRVAKAHLVQSDFSDSTLNKCVVDVVSRTSFRAFDGDAIDIARFPISF